MHSQEFGCIASKIISVLMFASLTIGLAPAQAEEAKRSLKIAGIENNQFNVLTGDIIRHAYKRLGRKADIVYLPGKRALVESSSGKFDAEVSRIFKIGEMHPSLIRVPVPFLSFSGTVFTMRDDVVINRPEDLAKYHSGVLSGIVYSDNLTKDCSRIVGDSVEQLFNLMDNGRVDLVIVTKLSGQIEMTRDRTRNKVRQIEKPLIDVPVYHYIHQKNKDLVPRIEAVLREMLESGEIDKMKSTFINKLARQISLL